MGPRLIPVKEFAFRSTFLMMGYLAQAGWVVVWEIVLPQVGILDLCDSAREALPTLKNAWWWGDGEEGNRRKGVRGNWSWNTKWKKKLNIKWSSIDIFGQFRRAEDADAISHHCSFLIFDENTKHKNWGGGYSSSIDCKNEFQHEEKWNMLLFSHLTNIPTPNWPRT